MTLIDYITLVLGMPNVGAFSKVKQSDKAGKGYSQLIYIFSA